MREKLRRFPHNRFYLSVVALCLTVLLGTGVVFAWFLMDEKNSVGGMDTPVVSGSEVTMELSVDETEAGTLTFVDAAPSKVYTCRLKFYNHTVATQYFHLDFLNVDSEITDGEGAVNPTMSLLNVFAVKGVKPDGNGFLPEEKFTTLLYRMSKDPTYTDDRNVRILEGIPILGALEEGGTNTVELTLYIKFLEEIYTLDETGEETRMFPDAEENNRNINLYQGQTFRIGQIRVGI